MVKEDKQRHQDLILKTIHHLEKIGHTDVKADISGYESPTSFSMKNRGTTVTPDIVSTSPHGNTHYVDLGVKSDYPVLLKSKWKFLQTLFELKNRTFRIVTHRGHYSFTDKLVGEMNSVQPAMRM